MLRPVRGGDPRLLGERFDCPLTLRQELEEFDAHGTAQRLAELGVMPVEAVFEMPVCSVGHIQVINRSFEYALSPLPGRERSIHGSPPYTSILRRRRALAITETELKLIAAAAIIGLSNKPKNGYSTPA